jgi:hypothetical protein
MQTFISRSEHTHKQYGVVGWRGPDVSEGYVAAIIRVEE